MLQIFLALEDLGRGRSAWRLVGTGNEQDIEHWHERYNADRGYLEVMIIPAGDRAGRNSIC